MQYIVIKRLGSNADSPQFLLRIFKPAIRLAFRIESFTFSKYQVVFAVNTNYRSIPLSPVRKRSGKN